MPASTRPSTPTGSPQAFRRVHLPDLERYLDRYPHQLSGGQLQRVVLARALVLTPRFLVADEPVSMLDVSVRAGILALMREVRDAMGLTAVYISHDLALVRYLCERTVVMYLGTVVEDGPTAEIVRSPRHPYTRALVAAVPVPDADQSRAPLPITGNVPDAREPPSGCRFRDRCPHAFARCAAETPALGTAAGHRVVPSGIRAVELLITSPPYISISGGTARPIALAVARLIDRSNLFGCSTGSSAGLAPLSRRST